MKTTITLILLFISINVFSQELKEKKWALKIDAMQLIDIFSFQTLQLSAERKINPYISINTEFGSQIFKNKEEEQLDTIYYKPKGFKANIEARIYIFKYLEKRTTSKMVEFYSGLKVFYRQNQNTNTVSYSPINDPDTFYNDTFGVKRYVKGASLILGSQFTLWKRIIMEPFIGWGFQNKKIKNTNISYREEKDLINGSDLTPLFQMQNLEEDSGNDLDFSMGFRIGYKF